MLFLGYSLISSQESRGLAPRSLKEELAPRGAQAQVQVQIQVHLGKHCSKRLFKLALWAKDQQDWIN